MTYKQVQDRVLDRLNLTSTDARTRIKNFINERYRNAVTSCSMQRVRMGNFSATTVSGATTVTVSGAKPVTITMPALNRGLGERSLDQLRSYDPSGQWSGAPQFYAVTNFGAQNFTLQLMPKPDGAYVLNIDGYALGIDLTADADLPAFPEDFHDLLIFGVLADEYDHMGEEDKALKQEAKFARRLADLRYFIAKSTYLHRLQNGTMMESSSWFWLYGFPLH